ncbi:MAG: hypothetical protein LBB51_00375, partial [Zoogloeaceae bacterium]|nr:hypothetical protein [Zoogloeaceae bacterium]
VQSKVEETPFQTKRRRLPFPLPQTFGGEGAPSGAGEWATRRVVKELLENAHKIVPDASVVKITLPARVSCCSAGNP